MSALQNIQKTVTQYTPNMTSIMGPKYDYAAQLPTPGDVGVRPGDGSWSGIQGAMGGVDYYSDTIGFGENHGFAKDLCASQNPLGLKFFLNTGIPCSNGQDMYEYINTIPKDLPGRLGAEIQNTLHVRLRGLAPGIFQDAASALDPAPMFNSVMNSGFARCRKVTLPVGDANGKIQSQVTGEWWIDPSKEQVTYDGNGNPQVSHWIFDSWINANEYNSDAKVEGFRSGGGTGSKLLAGTLFAALFVGLVAFTARRQ